MHALAIITVVALQLVFPPAKKQAAPPSAATAPRVLQFNWPEGLDVLVATERTREQLSSEKAKPARRVKGTYRMRVRPHEHGLIVRHEEFSGLEANEIGMKGLGVEDLVASLVPSSVVTREGTFVRAEDTAAAKNVLMKMVEPFVTGKEAMPPQFKQMLAHLASDDFLNSTAASEWNALVGAWLDFPIGADVFEDTVEEPSPVLPDMMIPLKVTQRMLEKSDCRRGGARYECAVFELRSQTDRATMEALLGRLLNGVTGLPSNLRLEQMEFETVVHVQLETATMVPHELTTTKTISLTMSAPGQPAVTTRQIERRTSRFSY